MKKFFIYMLCLVLVISFQPVLGQFNGGDYDGFSDNILGITSFNIQDLYCSGGSEDGYHSAGTGLIMFNDQAIYCQGGSSDGYSSDYSLLVTVNEQMFYCMGGIEDGASSSCFSGYPFDPEDFFAGGIQDGWSSGLYQGAMYTLEFCFGSQGDGWGSWSTGNASLNVQEFYCSAVAGDGFDAFSYSGHLYSSGFFCLGGPGDGYISDTSGMEFLGYGIWTGAASNIWDMATNWKHNIIPTENVNVMIPAGTTYYPSLNNTLSVSSTSGMYRCKRMDILSGAHLSSNSSITIDGILNISGTLTFHQQSASTIQINPTGRLTIISGGELSEYTGQIDQIRNFRNPSKACLHQKSRRVAALL